MILSKFWFLKLFSFYFISNNLFISSSGSYLPTQLILRFKEKNRAKTAKYRKKQKEQFEDADEDKDPNDPR